MSELPSLFKSNIINLHGERGREWMERLPSLISLIEDLWSIRVAEPYTTLTYHYVAPAIKENGAEAILKLGVPGLYIDREAECLNRYRGNGAVQLFEFDSDLGALLLERIHPGSSIKELSDRIAIKTFVGVMNRLHAASIIDVKLPTVKDWFQGFQRLRNKFGGDTGPLPPKVFDKAESLYSDLASSMDKDVLLHGDLHHENILASERSQWIAIDPQGVVGEPCYEIGAFLRNPMPEILTWPDLDKVTRRRVAQLSEITGYCTERISGWGYAQAVLSAIWSVEDHGSYWDGALHVAGAIQAASA
jgi:streptomycin 6-kinase